MFYLIFWEAEARALSQEEGAFFKILLIVLSDLGVTLMNSNHLTLPWKP